jgi:hypothetical protein
MPHTGAGASNRNACKFAQKPGITCILRCSFLLVQENAPANIKAEGKEGQKLANEFIRTGGVYDQLMQVCKQKLKMRYKCGAVCVHMYVSLFDTQRVHIVKYFQRT